MSGLADWGQLLQGIGAVALALVTLAVGIVAAASGIKLTFRNRLDVAQRIHVRRRDVFAGVSLDDAGPRRRRRR